MTAKTTQEEHVTTSVNRRTVLKYSASTLVGALTTFAGCLGGGGGDDGDDSTTDQTGQPTKAGTATSTPSKTPTGATPAGTDTAQPTTTGTTETGSPAGTSSQTDTTPSLLEPSERCGPPLVHAKPLHFMTPDGVRLKGATLGSGEVGILIAHQSSSYLCDGWPYAVHLSRQGYRVLLFDFRCHGLSECPGGDADARLVQDIKGGIEQLKRLGATQIVLLGGSMGGTVVLKSAAVIRPSVDGVISLSAEAKREPVVGQPINARASMERLQSPLLMIVAKQDPYISAKEARAMYKAAGTSEKRLLVLPASFGHGFEMLGFWQDWSRVDKAILRFLQNYTGSAGQDTNHKQKSRV